MISHKTIVSGIITVALLAIIAIFSVHPVDATQSLFYTKSTWNSSYATTSPTYMTPGTGTTTVVINSDAAGPGVSLDSIDFLYSITATSTGVIAPAVGVAIYDSIDGIDYYARTNELTPNATTTLLTGSAADYRIVIATSTANLGASNSLSRVNGSINVPVRARYTQARFYIPTAGGNIGLYVSPVAKAQK